MNFQFLSEHEAELVEEMRRLGYAETYINRHRTIISQITGNASNYEWQSYADVFGWYWDTYQSPTYIRDIRAVVENLEAFHLHGKYPSGQKGSNSLCSRRDSYSRLNAKYRSVMDYYSVVLSDMDLQESTRYSALHKSSSFLLELQLNGEDSLNKVTEKGVLRCFFNNDRQIRGASCAGAVRRFLLQCVDFNSECQRIVAYVPRFRNSRKNIQYLSPEEVSLIRLVIDDAENTLCYKDRAIGMLLLYTGMRGSDVAHLCVGDIDWEKDVIRFRQQKTSETVELPLKTIVGNAIYDYCTNERPNNGCDRLFLSSNTPHNGLTSDGIGSTVHRLMAVASIRQNKGDRHGTHIFRHRLATSLLDNNVAAPVISSTLGHTSPASLENYLYTDIERLRTCSLSIGEFPVGKEVFPL